jgi:hypothetical protein
VIPYSQHAWVAASNLVASVASKYGLRAGRTQQVAEVNFFSSSYFGSVSTDQTYHIGLSYNNGGYKFSPGSILNLESLAARLNRPPEADRVSRYLTKSFSPTTRRLLSEYGGGTNLDLQVALAKELNHIAWGVAEDPTQPDLYDPNRFAGVQLSARTWALVNMAPVAPLDRGRLNRMLLQDAFPQEFAPITEGEISLTYSQASWSGRITEEGNDMDERLTLGMRAAFGDVVQIRRSSGTFHR